MIRPADRVAGSPNSSFFLPGALANRSQASSCILGDTQRYPRGSASVSLPAERMVVRPAQGLEKVLFQMREQMAIEGFVPYPSELAAMYMERGLWRNWTL